VNEAVQEARTHAPGRAQRRAELDYLRVGAVLLVFLVHVSQIFSPFETWHIESTDRSHVLGLFTVFLGPWLMPLFMLVAGASTWFALRSRSVSAFFQARVLRLLVPLVAGTLLVIPPQQYLRRLARGEFEGSYLSFYPRFFDGFYPDGNFSYGHLWFLAYLFIVMTLSLPVLQYLRGPGGRGLLARVASVCDRGLGLLWLTLPLAASQLVLRIPFTQTTGAMVNDWATHAWFLLIFLYGFAIMAEPRLQDALDRQWRWAAIPALAALAVLVVYAWPGDVYERMPGQPSAWYVAFWVSFTTASWAWLVVIFGAARRHLGRPTPWLRHITEAAYPFYILHQPVIVFTAYHLVDRPFSVGARFAAIGSSALVITVLLLEAVRRVPGLRTLLGLPPARGPTSDAPATV
jgi:glucans biosynthesis protein C